jgi:hypothetical protein
MSSTSDIYIEGAQGDPAVQAQKWLTDRDDELLAEASAKTALLTELLLAPAERQLAQAAMIAFCAEHVLPHLVVTDSVLYAPVADVAETRLLVSALRRLHSIIARHVHELDTAGPADDVRAAAHAVVTVLAACLEVERTVFLPALRKLKGIDLLNLASDREALLRGQEYR